MSRAGSTEICLEDRIEIERLLNLGYKLGCIASILGRSASGIKLEVSRNGHRSNYNAKQAHEAAIARKNAGSRKKEKNLTPEKIEQINNLLKENLSINRICNECQISHHLLKSYLQRHQLKTTPMNYTGFDMRIRALEAQMEIALEKIKELYEQN